MVTSHGYLTTGVGYAHHPHRDTWYSAPLQQVNWWIPLYDICPENTIAFHPYYWEHAIRNGSSQFNYYQWNSLRKNVAQHVRADTRFQPKAEEPLDHLEPAIRLVVPKDGAVVFSGAQLHSTVPNTSGVTRYSIDFRTVNFDDVTNHKGAPNIDSCPQGTSLRDFMHALTMDRISDEVIREYDKEEPVDGVLVFRPEVASGAER
jgi:ectoine hydroxylase-related dioxygenase (phytanoyl-CoA dioxygenase family)